MPSSDTIRYSLMATVVCQLILWGLAVALHGKRPWTGNHHDMAEQFFGYFLFNTGLFMLLPPDSIASDSRRFSEYGGFIEKCGPIFALAYCWAMDHKFHRSMNLKVGAGWLIVNMFNSYEFDHIFG